VVADDVLVPLKAVVGLNSGIRDIIRPRVPTLVADILARVAVHMDVVSSHQPNGNQGQRDRLG
jgi:hypothetical protein